MAAEILIDYPSTYVRIVLRIIFSVLLLATAFIGGRCCVNRVKLRLLKHGNIKVSQMTGWLTGTQAAVAAWNLRASPSGFLGLIMVLTSLLWIVTDLAVSGLVTQVNVFDRCNFNESGLYSVIYPTPFDYYVEAAPTGSLFNLIFRAQLTSVSNGGLNGIYGKTNTDPTFRADSIDVVGGWTCDLVDSQSYPKTTSGSVLQQDLAARSTIYTESNTGCWQSYPDGSIGHVVEWSANQPNEPTDSWNVRAAIDMLANGTERVLNIYQCTMNGTELVNWILPKVQVEDTLQGWCDELIGNLYSNTGRFAVLMGNPASILESVLNTIVMTAGSATSPTTVAPNFPTQGCVGTSTTVPWPIVLLLAIIFVSVVAMTIYWMVLAVLILAAKRSISNRAYRTSVTEHTPCDLTGWMRQAVRETGVGALEGRDPRLMEQTFGYVPTQATIGILRPDMTAQEPAMGHVYEVPKHA